MAAEAFELYSLTSKLELDTSQFDRAYGDSQRKVKALVGDLRQIEGGAKTTGKAINSDLGGAVNRLLPSLGGLGAAGPAGLAAAGIALIGGAAITTAKSLIDLTLSVADQIDSLGDLSDKINFSVRTISGMGQAIEGAGGDIESFGASLGIFDKNIEKVAQGDKRLSALFKELNIDATNNEQAFRQVAKVIFDLGGTSQQTALAMELFGKSGKDMVGIIKAAGGDVEEFIKQAERMGFVIGQDAVDAADKLDKSLITTRAQVDAVVRQLGTELMPMVQEGVTNFSNWMSANRGEIAKTVSDIVKLIKTIGELASYIQYLSPIILVVKTVHMLSNLLPDNSGTSGAAQSQQYQRNLFTIDPNTGRRIYQGNAPYEDAGEYAIAGGAGSRSEGSQNVPRGKATKTEQEMLADRIRQLLSRGAGGGGGGGRSGKSEAEREAERAAQEEKRLLEQRLDLIARLNNDYKELTAQLQGVDVTTRAWAVSEAQLTGILKGASPELIKQAETAARVADQREQLLEIQKQLNSFLKEQDAAFRLAVEGEKSHLDTSNEFIQSLEKKGAVLQDLTKFWIRFKAVVMDSKENIKDMLDMMRESADLVPAPGGRVSESETVDLSGIGEPPPEDPMAKWRALIDDFSYDITHTINDAIRTGFEDGMSAGVKAFGLGIAEMASHEALDMLRRAIRDALGGGSAEGESGGGSGGFFSTLIKAGFSLISGIFGGGAASGGLGSSAAGAIGGHASGGFIFPNEWSWVGEGGRELVKAGPRGLSVASNQESMGMFGGGGLTVNQTINVPDMYHAGNRATQTQALRGLTQVAQRGFTLRG